MTGITASPGTNWLDNLRAWCWGGGSLAHWNGPAVAGAHIHRETTMSEEEDPKGRIHSREPGNSGRGRRTARKLMLKRREATLPAEWSHRPWSQSQRKGELEICRMPPWRKFRLFA